VKVCPGCGEENPEKFRLCGFCGTPLEAAPEKREVRKNVTVVFSDVVGSTALGERLDPEALRRLLTGYFEEMKTILEQHGGVVREFIGDAVMAIFGIPLSREDDALRAVRAAAQMRDRLHELNDGYEQQWGFRLKVRTGVNTGEVVTREEATDTLVLGDAINVAARLEQNAPMGEVLIGDQTFRLVRGAIDAEPVEPLELKGKSEPVPAFRLLSVRDGDPLARRLDAPIVGREEELRLLAEAFDTSATAEACGLVTILGEPGVGKSRLTGEFVRNLEGRATVIRGRCLPYGQGLTFWPLAEAVREAAAIQEGDSAEVAHARLTALVEDAEVRDRIGSAMGHSLQQFPVEEIFWAARKLLESLALEQPVVAVFDDLHWAETTFLELVDHVVESARAPVLLVCTARQDVLDRWEASASGSEGLRLHLEPLSADAAGLIVENLLGGNGISAALRARVVTAAEGNPLFVEQMLSMLIDDGLLRQANGGWEATGDLTDLAVPATIHSLMAARLDSLGDEERAVIEAAAVGGLEFPQAAVEELVGNGLRARVAELLAGLSRKQLLQPAEEDAHVGPQFRFQHIVIRDAAYARLLKETRVSLHEKFVEWVDGVVADRSFAYEEILGWHLEEAYRNLAELGPLDAHGIELGVRAAERLEAAGRRAFARGDMPAAANLLRRAGALLPELSPIRLAFLPDLGEALVDTGEFAEAGAVLDQVIDAAALIGDAALLAEARLVRLLVARRAAQPEGWAEEVEREAERSRPVFEAAGAHPQLARMWRLLGYVYATACRYGDAATAAQRAMEHARLADDVRQEARAATTYATAALHGPTPVGEAIRRCEEIVARALGDRQTEGLVLCAMSHLEALAGEIAKARELYAGARALLVDAGDRVVAASTSLDSAAVELVAGNGPAAESQLRQDYETLESLGDNYILPTVAAMLAEALYTQTRYDDALAFSQTAEELGAPDDVDAQSLWRRVRAKVLARQGRLDEAEALARAAVELLRPTDAIVMQADALSDLGEVLRLAGREDEARAMLADAAGLYERKGRVVTAARGLAGMAP
jgi:class 3 adenylate cyclase/tetratricopeptide (TPR) repeat protein